VFLFDIDCNIHCLENPSEVQLTCHETSKYTKTFYDNDDDNDADDNSRATR